MAENREKYFIRVRGRIVGPFDMAELQRRVRLGTLARVHEVSLDRQTWQPATDLTELFSVPATTESPLTGDVGSSQPIPLKSDVPDMTPAALPTSDSSGQAGSNTYFYSRNGVTKGPISWRALQALVSEKALQATDIVWEMGQNQPKPVSQWSGLAPSSRPEAAQAFAGQRADSGPGEQPVSQSRLERFLSQLNRLIIAESLCVAIVILFCAYVPHTRIQGRLAWWWNMLSQSGAVWLVVFSIYSVLAAIGLPIAAFLMRGQARGWVLASVGGLGLCLMVAVMAGGPRPCAELAIAIIPSALLALLVGVSISRSVAPTPETGRVLHGLIGGLSCGASLLAMLAAVIFPLVLRREQGLPGWAIMTMIALTLGWMAGLAGGLVSLGAARGSLSRTANKACIIILLASIGLLAVAAVIAGFGLTELFSAEEGAKFLLVQMLRLVVATYSLNALLAIGVSDIVASRWAFCQETETLLQPNGAQSQ